MSIFDFLKKKKPEMLLEDDILKEDPLKENNDILNTEKNFDMNKFSAFNEENKPTTPGPEYTQHSQYQNNMNNNISNNMNNAFQNTNINQEIIIIKKDIELLNEKMNSLKTILESINQRLQNIEEKNNYNRRW